MSGGGLVVLDGRAYAPEDAAVSVFDRGFLYGDGVFESLRTYERVPYLLAEHVARLFESARALRIAPPLSAQALEREVLDAIARVPGDVELYVRLMLTRGRGRLGVTPSRDATPTRVVLLVPLEAPDASRYARGLAVRTVRAQPPLRGTSAASAKAMRYLANVVALAEAREHGCDEALFVDDGGFALEGATSNVFAVTHDTVVTPPVSSGILPGLTRGRALELCAKIGIVVEERSFSPRDPALAEMFVTSSLREVMPVTRVDGRAVGAGVPGPVTAGIHTIFRRSLPGAPPPYLTG
jgi:branched-chain amino acid aminotransferase